MTTRVINGQPPRRLVLRQTPGVGTPGQNGGSATVKEAGDVRYNVLFPVWSS